MDKEVSANNGNANIPTSMEEMRKKRLAYFDTGQSKQTVSEWKILYPSHSSLKSQAQVDLRETPECPESDAFSSHNLGTEKSQDIDNDLSSNQFVTENDRTSNTFGINNTSMMEINHGISRTADKINTPLPSKQEPQYSSGRLDYNSKEPQPLKSRKGKSPFNSIESDFSHLPLKDSQENYSETIFSSHPDLGELGLSTHRPESETSARIIQGELFMPTSQGPGKTTKQIFSEKIQQEMRSALGDEKMDELMMKVNADIGHLHQQTNPPNRIRICDDSKINNHHQDISTLKNVSNNSHPQVSMTKSVKNSRSRAGNQSPQRHQSSKVQMNFQDREREVPALVRNYDQITVPKNTRNSFSSEEIYRQAYGGCQENSGNLLFRRWSNVYPDYSDYPPQPDSRPHILASVGRKSVESNSSIIPPSSSHFQNYNTYSVPPPAMPSPVFDSQGHNVPLSPHTTHRAQVGSVPMLITASHSYPCNYFPDGPNTASPHYVPFMSPSLSSSPNAIPVSNPFFYPPLPNFGAPRFPDNVPFSANPSPHHPHQSMKNGQAEVPLEQRTRRHSFTLHGLHGDENPEDSSLSSSLKVPHPPVNPPAISRYEEHSEKVRQNLEGRRPMPPSGQLPSRANEKDFNSFNLQRYFSSIDLSPEFKDQPVINSTPQSSRSVDGDFVKSSYDDNVSSFTNTTEITSATKAGGITNRLADLGVNLDHLKHLWVVDSKADVDASSQLVRRCPECGTANKTYMMWCIECSESLIGIEPSMPRGRKTKQKASFHENKGMSTNISPWGKIKTKRSEQESKTAAVDNNNEDLGNFRKDSPESGRGISLSSSPIRYHRDQDETVEPQDSGRASCGDPKEVNSHLVQETTDQTNNFEEYVDSDEVEYIYEDVEADIYEQISDPILRDFIISYRNRQELNLDPILNSYVAPDTHMDEKNDVHPRKPHQISKTHLNHDLDRENNVALVKTSNTSEMVDPPKSNGTLNSDQFVNNDSGFSVREDNLKQSGSFVQDYDSQSRSDQDYMNTVPPTTKSTKPKKKKKKHKSDAIDIEIFGYEETRQSRDSSHGANLVPILNLARSSDEESSSEEESDEENEAVNYSNDQNEVSHSYKTVKNSVSQPSNEKAVIKNPKSNPIPVNVISKPFKSSAQASSSLSSRSLSHATPTQPGDKSGSRIKAKGNNPVPTNYQRHWARSSIAWTSYNSRELSTKSSIPVSQQNITTGSRPSSARVLQRKATASDEDRNISNDVSRRQRPASAEYGRTRKVTSNTGQQQRPSSASNHFQSASRSANFVSKSASTHCISTQPSTSAQVHRSSSDFHDISRNSTNELSVSQPMLQAVSSTSSSGVSDSPKISKDNFSPRLLCSELHRLPNEDEDESSDKMHAIAKTAYDRFHELTPRIQDGGLSLWQCLPDEIWLYILSYLKQADLAQLMLVSKSFHRLANDVTLWRYITVKPRYSITDEALGSIACHKPISLAMVKCQGANLSHEALDTFFRETKDRLKELNICGCSQGSLIGSVVLETASKYCHNLSHLDVSFCNIRDDSFMSIVNCVNKLESVCINGFQTMSDSALLALLKKHGKSLHTLELYACFSLTASVLRKLGDFCTKLRRLCLGGCNKLTDSTMITLSTHLARIEELDLRGCKNLRNDCIRKIVRNCPRIRTLVLANCQQISDAALVEMGTYLKSTLRIVDVCGCNLVGDQGVISLAKNCDQLASLDISSTKCTSNSLIHLANSGCSRWLKTLKLSFLTGLSEASMLNLLKHCPRLKLIHIFGCPSLKNLAKLRAANLRVCIEGDIEMPRLSSQY